MSKRVLVVTEAGDAWPSGWVRALIYRDLFRKHDIHVDYISRQSPWLASWQKSSRGRAYNRLLNAGLAGILGRIGPVVARGRENLIVQRARRGYDVIYLQKAGSLSLISLLKRAGIGKLVFDLNDAVWLPVHSTYANGKVREILQAVDAVTCDNPYGLAFARSYNPNVFLVPDPAQVELFDLHRVCFSRTDRPLVLGWIGGVSTSFNLFVIWEALETVFSRHREIELRLIGTGYSHSLLPRFEQVNYSVVPNYSQSDIARHVLNMDIGLFPLFNVQDSQARGILKATIYMSGEAAVIASPRGQVSELIRDGVNGMLANSTQEWIDKLERLITDHALRRRIASAGLETVRRDYRLDISFAALLRALGLSHK